MPKPLRGGGGGESNPTCPNNLATPMASFQRFHLAPVVGLERVELSSLAYQTSALPLSYSPLKEADYFCHLPGISPCTAEARSGALKFLAEERGIEPLKPCGPTVFKTASSTNRTSSVVASEGIEPPPPVCNTGALTITLTRLWYPWRDSNSRRPGSKPGALDPLSYRGKLVDQLGLEPRTPACKAGAFPVTPQAHDRHE